MASPMNMYTPVSPERLSAFSCPKFPLCLRASRSFQNNVKVSAEKRDNLDHWQRLDNQQPQSKKASPTVLWDRFPTARTVQQMLDSMERMMEDPFNYDSTWSSASPTDRDGYGRRRTPWAIKEADNEYKMRFDMPGMNKYDVKVWIEENMLVVKAEKVPKTTQESAHEDTEDEEWPAKSYGRYGYRIALPEDIEFEKIQAVVKDGVLSITIPKSSSTSKIIDIDVQ